MGTLSKDNTKMHTLSKHFGRGQTDQLSSGVEQRKKGLLNRPVLSHEVTERNLITGGLGGC